MPRSIAFAAALLASVLMAPSAPATAGPATAIAQAHARLSVRPDTVHPGDTVVVAGRVPVRGAQACPAGDPAILTSTAALFPPDGIGPLAPRGPSGKFKFEYVVQSSTPPGTYLIGVRCGGGNVGVSTTLRVV
jgi:hypothetical protein